MANNVKQLSSVPSLGGLYLKAASGMLPVIGKPKKIKVSASFPKHVNEVKIKIDHANLSEYCKLTGFNFGNTMPATYGFSLAYPVIMNILTDDKFPFIAVGAVHLENTIECFRKINVNEELTLKVYAKRLREHRAGILVDFISEFYSEGKLVMKMVSSFLNKQKTSLSDKPRVQEELPFRLPPANRTLIVTKGLIKQFASNTGDKNPIHVSGVGAKMFGFQSSIAHGMWSAAAALALVENQLPDKYKYTVTFGKPILLPATVAAYVKTSKVSDKTRIVVELKSPKKFFNHLEATINEL